MATDVLDVIIVEEQYKTETLRWKAIANASPSYLLLVRAEDYRIQLVNDAYQEAHGLPEDKIVGKTIVDMRGNDFVNRGLQAKFDECVQTGKAIKHYTWLPYGELGRRYVEVVFTPFDATMEGSVVRDVVITVNDLTETERKNMVDRVKAHADESFRRFSSAISFILATAARGLPPVDEPLRKFFDALIQHLLSGKTPFNLTVYRRRKPQGDESVTIEALEYDAQGNLVSQNVVPTDSYQHLFGGNDTDDAIPLDDGIAFPLSGAEHYGYDYSFCLRPQKSVIMKRKAWEVWTSLIAKDMKYLHDQINILIGFYRHAGNDPLTGLFNRGMFEKEITKLLCHRRKTEQPMAIAMLDGDKFKLVNDTHGHPAGDEVLREIARRMKKIFRDTDLIVRYGGEEFTVVLTGVTGKKKAQQKFDEFREYMEKNPIRIPSGKEITVTMSIGWDIIPVGEDTSWMPYLERADIALYAAKEAGRNRVVAYDEKAHAEIGSTA